MVYRWCTDGVQMVYRWRTDGVQIIGAPGVVFLQTKACADNSDPVGLAPRALVQGINRDDAER